jgi:adenylate cyclase
MHGPFVLKYLVLGVILIVLTNKEKHNAMKLNYPICYLNNTLFTSRKMVVYTYQVLAWVISANVFIILKAWGVPDQTGYLIFSKPDNLFLAHVMASSMGLLIGIILAIVDDLRLNSRLRRRGFGAAILVKGAAYLFTIILVVLAISFAFLFILGSDLEEALHRHKAFASSSYFVTIVVYGGIVSLVASFIRQIDSKFGPGNLLNMLIGKYQRPKAEDRIFMFLDLKNATPYAEKLGHFKYSRMLQDCFHDITKVINAHYAEVYQYVGDEIVLTWKSDVGVNNANCIRIFYSFLDVLNNRSDYYMKRYGVVPVFKAGLNCGHVTVAEIGSLKREIAYHGDVINTASRIQCQCNKYGKNLLVSGQLVNRLKNTNGYSFEFTKAERLKGKKLPVEIFAVKPAA